MKVLLIEKAKENTTQTRNKINSKDVQMPPSTSEHITHLLQTELPTFNRSNWGNSQETVTTDFCRGCAFTLSRKAYVHVHKIISSFPHKVYRQTLFDSFVDLRMWGKYRRSEYNFINLEDN